MICKSESLTVVSHGVDGFDRHAVSACLAHLSSGGRGAATYPCGYGKNYRIHRLVLKACDQLHQ